MTTVRVVERSESEVPRAVWDQLRLEAPFWQLVDAKVLTPKARKDGSVSLAAGNQVGLAQCGETLIVIEEKIEGALASLLASDASSVRSMTVPGRVSSMLTLVEHVVDAFLSSVYQYVSTGRDWRYERVQRQGSVVGGRVLVSETVLLRATGRPQLVAFDKRRISHVTDTNQVVAATLRVTEGLHSSGLIAPATVARARSMAAFFHDNQTAKVLFGDRRSLATRATELVTGTSPNLDAMLSLAAVLLSGAGLGVDYSHGGRLPITWFVNLETLFESVVRARLAHRLGEDWRVEKGGEVAFLFSNPDYLNVDPDLVATRDQVVRTRLVGDVKYKDLSGQPSASDLYQLIAHSTALGSETAFLIYPGRTFSRSTVGRSATGVTVNIGVLDVLDIDKSVDEFVQSIPQFV